MAMDWSMERAAMVDTLRGYGVKDERILGVMRVVPRHLFIYDLCRW